MVHACDMCVTRVSHICYTHGVNHTRMGFLDSICMYTHAHTVFTQARVFTCVYACMVNVHSYVVS